MSDTELTPPPKRPRVLLADDHRMLREAFARLLEATCDVVTTVGDGLAVLAVAAEQKVDLAILDVAMPLLNGLDTTRELTRRNPEVRVIILTVNEDPDVATEAFRVGASGFLLKNSAASELTQAVQEVLAGGRYLTPLATQGLVDSLLRPASPERGADTLTPRQIEVLRLLAEGHTMKEIARMLGITTRTVAFHKYTMMTALGIESSAELIRFAIRQHIVSAS